jgi:hypothetical protein
MLDLHFHDPALCTTTVSDGGNQCVRSDFQPSSVPARSWMYAEYMLNLNACLWAVGHGSFSPGNVVILSGRCTCSGR